MVVKFSRELEEFQCFMRLLSGGVPDGLVSRSRLWSVVSRYFPSHETDQGVLTYLRGDLKRSFVEALLDDLSDGRLRESARIDFIILRLDSCSPLYQSRLHSDLNEAVV